MTLVVLDPALCPTCGHPLALVDVVEPALVRHGGYGASRRTSWRHCPACGWLLRHLTAEIRPEPACTT